MLKVGDTAPDFTLRDADDEAVSLASLLEKGPLILYFYPADFTPGCTAEACDIRDMHSEITAVNANVVGISPQSGNSHQRFRDRYELPFPLLVDTSKSVIKAYGVNGPLGMGVRRVTYLINPDGMIADRVVADFAVKDHIKFIEQVVEDLGGY